LNHHRIHTALYGLRHHALTGAPDLVFRELPLKIDRPPYQPRSNKKSKHRTDDLLRDKPTSSRETSRTILRMSFWLNVLLVRDRARQHRCDPPLYNL